MKKQQLRPVDNDSDDSGSYCVRLAECCCIFNLCYCFDDETVCGGSDEDELSEMLLANSGGDQRHQEVTIVFDSEVVPLSVRATDDNFTLPRAFDAMQAYYDLYEHLANTDPTLSARTPRDSPRVDEQAVVEAMKLLGGRTGTAPEVSRAFVLLLLAIRGTETGSEKRAEYIRQCDYYRDQYSRDEPDDRAHAELYCREVAGENRARNKKQLNVLYYQKAIYYTHHASAKLVLIRDYIAYCDSLKEQ